MGWFELRNGVLAQADSGRVNDVFNLGDEWWAASSSGDVWHWRGREEPRHLHENQGHVRAIAMAPGGRVGWLGRLPDAQKTRLAKTVDGGVTFTEVVLPSTLTAPKAICAIEVLDAENAWAAGAFFRAGNTPALLHTTDGTNWNPVLLPDAELSALTDVWFFDADNGIAVGGRKDTADTIEPAIFVTNDGGRSWERAEIGAGVPASRYCWKVHFVNRSLGFAALDAPSNADAATLLKSIDGGRTWAPLTVTGQIGNLQGVAFLDQNRGWTCKRNNKLVETNDGGATWTSVAIPNDVNRIIVARGIAVAGGDALYGFDPELP